MNIFSYRLRFAKSGRMRFLSHHDTMRLFMRALRRSGIPLRMTEGFNPRPIVSFPTALGLGIESDDEVLELELDRWTAPRQIEKLLGEQLPEGLTVGSAEAFNRKERSCIDFVEYEAHCPGRQEGLDERIRSFLALKTCPVERKSDKRTKTVEIRQYVMAVDHENDRVFLRIRVTDTGTAKPEEVLRALGIEPNDSLRLKKTYTEVSTRE